MSVAYILIMRAIFLECPGLAEFGHNMEVKNPLFSEETPASKNDKTDKGTPQSKTTK
jgi:hypothetical protein